MELPESELFGVSKKGKKITSKKNQIFIKKRKIIENNQF